MTYTIGRLAEASDVHVETIRYYQRRGLVGEPSKPPGGIRRYGEADADRLRFIKQAQTLGFSLNEVSDLLALEDGRHCREAERLGAEKLAVVRERIAQLRSVEKALAKMVGQCRNNAGKVHCPLIASLERDAKSATVPSCNHRERQASGVRPRPSRYG
ncbi:MAG: Hg(II)-responsive transcriptional regulator [Rhodanobacteraceae bacterium]|nr:MAG: Hg(II)-responsive transcriptional regulator [Rhodanobacteraceae bacterium]